MERNGPDTGHRSPASLWLHRSLWPSGQGYQAKGVLELEGCWMPGVGTTLGSGAREVNGEGGRKGRCQEPGLGISLWGDPGMPSNVKEAGDLPMLGGLGEEPKKLLGKGRRPRPEPFAQARTDPQGSLRRSQPQPLAVGARLYHHTAPAGGAAATVAPGGGLGRQQCVMERRALSCH